MDFNAYQEALSSQLRGLECPFPEQEFDERLARVRDGMAREITKLDARIAKKAPFGMLLSWIHTRSPGM